MKTLSFSATELKRRLRSWPKDTLLSPVLKRLFIELIAGRHSEEMRAVMPKTLHPRFDAARAITEDWGVGEIKRRWKRRRTLLDFIVGNRIGPLPSSVKQKLKAHGFRYGSYAAPNGSRHRGWH